MCGVVKFADREGGRMWCCRKYGVFVKWRTSADGKL